MTPMFPPKRSSAEAPSILDDVIQKIDESLPMIHQMCRIKQKRTRPTDRVRARFKELVEDPILNEDGTDIREVPPTKINGFHKKSEAG